MKEIMDIFPTAIGKYRMPQNGIDDVKEKCFDVIEEYGKTSEYVKANSNTIDLEHYFNKAGQSLLNTGLFDKFEEWIKQCSIDYINDTLGYECKSVIVTDCWLNKCDTDGYQFMHVHSNSYISGTYFVNFIKGKHSHLAFQSRDALPGASCKPYIEVPECKQTKYNSGGAIIDHDEGDLLLWESNLVHGYERNYADNRISISFNILPEVFDTRGSYTFRVTRDDTKLD